MKTKYKKIRRFICARIIGHKVDLYNTDSGYLYCHRCGSHEYYDTDFSVYALFLTHIYIKQFASMIYNKILDRLYRNKRLPF